MELGRIDLACEAQWVALLVVAMKRKADLRRVLVPLLGPHTAGVVWALRF